MIDLLHNTEYNTHNGYFIVSGYVSFIKSDDKMMYMACPDCSKKVEETDKGIECKHCNKFFEDAVPTYMLTCKFADTSDEIFISLYR